MDGEYAIQEAKERREPISITLADLSALVFGSALAISLPQMHLLTDRITIDNIPMPGWVAWLFMIGEVAMKVGLAVIPVVMARRARYGGLPRPADWLAVLIALPLLHEVVQRSGWIKRFARWYFVDFRSSFGYPISFLVREEFPGRGVMVGDRLYYGYDGFPAGFNPGDEFQLWGWFATVLFLGISATLGLGWKKMPGWAKTGLLWAAAFTWLAGVTYLLTPSLVQSSQAISERIGLPSLIVVQIALGMGALPEGFLICIPLLAVLLGARRGAIREWVWTGRMGAVVALLALLSGSPMSPMSPIYWYADLANRNDPLVVARLVMRALGLVVVGFSSWVIVERLGWAGSRSDCS